MMRRAKIIATIGPASSSEARMTALLKAGVDVARLNFSHGSQQGHREHVERLRRLARELGRPIAILQDLQGVKIRTGALHEGVPVQLEEGQTFEITTEPTVGDSHRVSTSFESLPRDVQPGSRVLLSDGLIELRVIRIQGPAIVCEVASGGVLAEHQGINLPGTRLSAPALTEKDIADLRFGLEAGIDYVALSFVRRPEDVRALKRLMTEWGAEIPVIAKIEKPEAVECLDEILEVVEGVMVARGDLGVEMSPECVPVIQKRIVQKAHDRNKISIIATQMLESMIAHPLPTRAEASDVANAVFDGADAMMLSGETAVGDYPIEAVEMMGRIIEQAEKVRGEFRHCPESEELDLRVPAAVCDAAFHAARAVSARLIAAFTESGFTAKLISRHRPETEIIGLTPHAEVMQRMSLYWGVRPMRIGEIGNVDELIVELERCLHRAGLVKTGDKVVIISGTPLNQKGNTNLMKLHEVGRSEA